MLDALAERVSSTLHRLSLFTEVQSERRTLADVLESSSDGIFTVGLDMAVRSWNPAMARDPRHRRHRGGRPAGRRGVPPRRRGRQARHGGADPGRTSAARGGPRERRGRRREERWLTCSWSPLSEGGYVVVARDETERKKIQDDKDGWIAQVSHELRTPLTPIKGFLHTLQRRDDQFTTDDRQRIYEVMLREEQRLEDLVNGLLQATTIDQRGLVVVPEVIDWATRDRRASRPLPTQRPHADDRRDDRPQGEEGRGRREPGHRHPRQPALQRAQVLTGWLADHDRGVASTATGSSPRSPTRALASRPATGSASSTSSRGWETTSRDRSRVWGSASTSRVAASTRWAARSGATSDRVAVPGSASACRRTSGGQEGARSDRPPRFGRDARRYASVIVTEVMATGSVGTLVGAPEGVDRLGTSSPSITLPNTL